MKVLQAHNVHKTFHRPAEVRVLSGIDFGISEGETIAIMGASGEGKSTLLHILGTLETPSKGSIEINGATVTRNTKHAIRNKHIGFIFQSFHLLEDYTTIDNILMPARIGRKSVKKGYPAYLHAQELLEMVGLSYREHFHVKLLSGGERQRVAIARALCNSPDIILADEPSGNLDHATSQQVHEILISCARQHNKAIIVATHDKELAGMCDTIYILRDGILTRK